MEKLGLVKFYMTKSQGNNIMKFGSSHKRLSIQYNQII